MSNEFYSASGNPGAAASLLSSIMRAEFTAIAAGFAKLPTLSGNANKVVVVNGGGTGLTVTTGALALAGNLTTTGAFNTTLIQGASVSLILPGASGTLATLAGTETLTNKTLVAPALGTPTSGVLTNCTGTAAGLIAGAATTATTATTALNLSGGSVSATTIVAMGTTTLLGGLSAIGGTRVNGDGSAQLQSLGVTTAGAPATVTIAPTGHRVTGVSSVAVAGASFTNNDILFDPLSGSVFTATVTAGAVTALALTVSGHVPGSVSNPVSLVGGTGTGCKVNLTSTPIRNLTLNWTGLLSLSLFPEYANDAAAAADGHPPLAVYRTGSVLMQRQS